MLARLRTVAFLAWHNLTGERRRWLVSTVAIGVATGLVLFAQGVVRWIDESSVAYLQHLPGRFVVLESGVDDFLLSQSTMPDAAVARLRSVPGVTATPVLAESGTLAGAAHPLPILLIGSDAGRGGGPWTLTSGRDAIGTDQVVLDGGLAKTNGLHVGSRVSLFGRRMTIVGLSGDTNAAGIFFAFAPLQTVQSMVGQRVVSDVAVHVAPGSSPPPALTAAVARIPKAHLIALGRLVSDDRHMIEAGFSQPVEILVAICLVVGLLITMMVLYTATVEHARDYALLKAIGTRPAVVSLVAVAQSLVLLVTGFLLGWGFAALLIAALRNLYPVINGYVEPGVLAEVAVFMVAVNLIALVLPLAFVRRVDPQEVFKA